MVETSKSPQFKLSKVVQPYNPASIVNQFQCVLMLATGVDILQEFSATVANRSIMPSYWSELSPTTGKSKTHGEQAGVRKASSD